MWTWDTDRVIAQTCVCWTVASTRYNPCRPLFLEWRNWRPWRSNITASQYCHTVCPLLLIGVLSRGSKNRKCREECREKGYKLDFNQENSDQGMSAAVDYSRSRIITSVGILFWRNIYRIDIYLCETTLIDNILVPFFYAWIWNLNLVVIWYGLMAE